MKRILNAAALFVLLQFQLVAAQMHAIIAADTLDDKIGTSVKLDVQKMKAEMEEIAENTGMKLNLKIIQGKDLLRENIEKALGAIKPDADDVVFFYYSGHGYRTESKETRWPAMYLRSKKSLDFTVVTDTILAKKPRLLIAISDSCNNVINEKWAPEFRKGSFTRAKDASYKKLFLEYRGHIFASGAIPGEYAMGNDFKGGFFTHEFLTNLKDAVKEEDPDWNEIMKKAAAPIVFTGGKQNPQHETQVSKIGKNTVATTTTTTTTEVENPDVEDPNTTDVTDPNTTDVTDPNTEDPNTTDVTDPNTTDPNTTDVEVTDPNTTDPSTTNNNKEDEACLYVLNAASAIAGGAQQLMEDKVSTSTPEYKEMEKYLIEFRDIAKEDGDIPTMQIYDSILKKLKAKKYNETAEEILSIFQQMEQVVNKECPGLGG